MDTVTATPSNIIPVDGLDNSSPSVSPPATVMNVEAQKNDKTTKTLRAYRLLQNKWSCAEPGHDLCLRGTDCDGHIQLSEDQVSIWVDEICRNQATDLYPPKTLIIPGPNRDRNNDWGVSETSYDPHAEDGVDGPGYLCGLVQERVGRATLYVAKVLTALGKISLYKWIVEKNYDRPLNLLSMRFFGTIVQETADLMGPWYPWCVRRRASDIFTLSSNVDEYSSAADYTGFMLQWLGFAFSWRWDNDSPEIMSAPYRSLTCRRLLHVHWTEVASEFIIILFRNLSRHRNYNNYILLDHLVFNVCTLGQLSPQALNVIHGYLQSSLQRHYTVDNLLDVDMRISVECSRQDVRFKILSEALLDVALDITAEPTPQGDGVELFFGSRAKAVNSFFRDEAILIDFTKKVDRIASFLALYLRQVVHISLSTDISTITFLSSHFLTWIHGNFDSASRIIETIIKLITISPDPEFSCTVIRMENVVEPLVMVWLYLDGLDSDSVSDMCETACYSLLCLIATPFTGLSVVSHSYCLGVLKTIDEQLVMVPHDRNRGTMTFFRRDYDTPRIFPIYFTWEAMHR
ncbi:hypothetical protein BU17DRAFT_79441 [Hysterangium stoloniferum]|nr:hypothetical protein BU17DRAFT_79441 [Hysterangium stoloniferum]